MSQGRPRFGTSKSSHGGGGQNRSRYSQTPSVSKKSSHHSRPHSRNLSVNSLPTITEEKNRNNRSSAGLAGSSQSKAYCMCKRDLATKSSGADEESKDQTMSAASTNRLCPRCHQQQRKYQLKDARNILYRVSKQDALCFPLICLLGPADFLF